MKLILNLTKIYIKETIAGIFGFKKSSKKIVGVLLFSLLPLILLLALGYEFWVLADFLSPFGFTQNVILLALIMAVLMTLFLSLTDSQGYIYKAGDYETLSAMPIRFSQIITAKYLSAYFITFLYSTIILLPAFVVYFIFTGASTSILFAAIALFLMPTFTQLISSILSWLVNILTSKMNNKNIFRSIASALIAVTFCLIFTFIDEDLFSIFIGQTPTWFNVVFAHVHFLILSITDLNVLYLLISIALCFVFGVLSVLVLMIGYKKINSNLLSVKNKKSKKPLIYKKSSVFSGLLKKEVYTIINSPTYFVNSIMGGIMSVVISITCIVLYNKISKDIPQAQELISSIFIGILVFSLTLCSGISPSSSSSISIEGQKFQNIKVLPIDFNDVALSKITLNLLIQMPLSIISLTIFIIFVKVPALIIALSLLYIIFAVLTQTFLGLLINLKFPKLNWTTEVQATKQGISLLITMLIDMVLSVVPMVLFFVLLGKLQNFNVEIFIGISFVLQVITFVLVSTLLFTKGKDMYFKIS